MAQLPLYRSDNPEFSYMQTRWKSALDPVLANPLINGLQLTDVSLSIGTTVINHRLGRKQQGWFLTDVNGAAQIYRSQALNDTTLTLTSDAAVTVSLLVY